MNKAILIGNLGKDPEVKSLQNGNKVCSFSLATNEKRNGETETTWHNIVLWNKTAEIAEKYLSKGAKVMIEGKISNRSYEDKDGNKKYVTEIVGFNLEMLGGDSPRSRSNEDSLPNQGNLEPLASGAPEDDLHF